MRISRINSICWLLSCHENRAPLLMMVQKRLVSTCSKAGSLLLADASIRRLAPRSSSAQLTDMMAASVVQSEISCRKTSLAYYSSSTSADCPAARPQDRIWRTVGHTSVACSRLHRFTSSKHLPTLFMTRKIPNWPSVLIVLSWFAVDLRSQSVRHSV